jgi:hypothetical protein
MLKNCLLLVTLEHQLRSIITPTGSSVHTENFSFNALRKMKKNTADDNSVHSAIRNADGEVYQQNRPDRLQVRLTRIYHYSSETDCRMKNTCMKALFIALRSMKFLKIFSASCTLTDTDRSITPFDALINTSRLNMFLHMCPGCFILIII